MTAKGSEITGVILIVLGFLIFGIGLVMAVASQNFNWWIWVIIIFGFCLAIAGAVVLFILNDHQNMKNAKDNENPQDYHK